MVLIECHRLRYRITNCVMSVSYHHQELITPTTEFHTVWACERKGIPLSRTYITILLFQIHAKYLNNLKESSIEELAPLEAANFPYRKRTKLGPGIQGFRGD